MMNARCTTTSASATRALTASMSSTSPRRYSTFSSGPGSNGRRAIPITRATRGSASSARRNARPSSPVGPVTATVRPLVVFVIEHDPPRLALALDARLDGAELAVRRVVEQLVGGLEAGDPLEVLDRREDHQQLARLRALQRPRRLEPAGVDDLLPVDLDLGAGGRDREEEVRVEADADF